MSGTGVTGLPRAVIFDMDGVLVDSEPIHTEATARLMAAHGVAYRAEHDPTLFGRTDREVFRTLKQRHGLSLSEDEMADTWIQQVVEMLQEPLPPLPGVPAVFDALKGMGLRLALASSSAPPIIAATLAGLGLGTMFEVTVSGHDVSRGKPSPDIFLETATRMGVPPARCLVVEDSQNGLRAALAAGMSCAVVPCGAVEQQDFTGADVRLTSLDELAPWIGGLANGERR
jgi:HAD superfamily hydrolase (TIGR01509 family)